MAHFYGELRGLVAEPVRFAGSKTTGLGATLQGNDTGVRVELSHEGGHDVLRAWRTGGAGGQGGEELVAEWSA